MISILRALVLIVGNASRIIPFRGVASLPQRWRACPLWTKLLWNAVIMAVIWFITTFVCLTLYGNDPETPGWWVAFSWFGLAWCLINPALAGLTHRIDENKS